ncbi:NAD(P)-binding protein [Corynespora cassiicola Philippines]|uniref:NAD(P)-binding protein n=1 Tax=Corynespora cassiicola Philippines TaxID=1448308 RepID=A0A2T2N7N1_CORCC|nr:NAD(P)-binding protein [Corynespora cassiicola Philippines]
MAPPSTLPASFVCTPKIDFSKTIDTSNLKGKNVIVTGGANGLGEGCVKAFAEAGAYVSILDIAEDKGQQVADALTEKEYHVQFIKTDTTSWDSQLAAFKSAINFTPVPALDLVLASAGLTGRSAESWLETTPKDLSTDPAPPSTATLDVNLLGLYWTLHLALHFFKATSTPRGGTEDGKEEGKGKGKPASKHLLLISSLAAYVPLLNIADYNASKYGVRGLWRAVRNSSSILGPDPSAPSFRCNLICPTFIRTQMTAAIEPGLRAMDIEMGEVADVVAAVVRVACDDAVRGRAVAVCKGVGEPGDRNFDLGDDWEGGDGGREVLEGILEGRLRGLEGVGRARYRDAGERKEYGVEEG